MENAPDIIIFWLFIMAVFVFMFVSMIAAMILLKKGKEQHAEGMRFAGKICLILSIICSVPIVSVAGYILYIYIG